MSYVFQGFFVREEELAGGGDILEGVIDEDLHQLVFTDHFVTITGKQI